MSFILVPSIRFCFLTFQDLLLNFWLSVKASASIYCCQEVSSIYSRHLVTCTTGSAVFLPCAEHFGGCCCPALGELAFWLWREPKKVGTHIVRGRRSVEQQQPEPGHKGDHVGLLTWRMDQVLPVRVQRGRLVKDDKVDLCQALKAKGLRVGREEKGRCSWLGLCWAAWAEANVP